jgi:hypothetical protein
MLKGGDDRMQETYVLVQDAADYLGVTAPRVFQLLSRGKLVGAWAYGRRVVTQKSLVEYARERLDITRRESSRVENAPCSQSNGQSAGSCSKSRGGR